jgi:hypothetical protein
MWIGSAIAQATPCVDDTFTAAELRERRLSLTSQVRVWPGRLTTIDLSSAGLDVSDEVSATVLWSGGSTLDPVGQEGAAELAEQVLLGRWSTPLAAAGLTWESATTDEYTRFTLCAPRAGERAVLGAVADLLAPLRPTPDEVEQARARVRARRVGQPVDTWGLRLRWLNDALFPPELPQGRLGRLTEPGFASDASPEAVEAALAARRPEGMVVVVRGAEPSWLFSLPRTWLHPRLEPQHLVGPEVTDPDRPGEHLEFPVDGPALALAPEPLDPPAPPAGDLRVRAAPVEVPTTLVGWTVPGGYAIDRWNAPHVAAAELERRLRGRVGEEVGCGAVTSARTSVLLCAVEGPPASAAEATTRAVVRAARHLEPDRAAVVLPQLEEGLLLVNARAPGPSAPTAVVARYHWATGSPDASSSLFGGALVEAEDLAPWLLPERAAVTVLVPLVE